MKRRSMLSSSRPIEFLPKRFFFLIARETRSHSLYAQPMKTADDDSFSVSTSPGIACIALDEYLTSHTSTLPRMWNPEIQRTVYFNAFLTNLLATSDVPGSNDVRSKVYYFYVRKRQHDSKAIHFICRWRLFHLQVSPREAAAPFEHLPAGCSVPRDVMKRTVVSQPLGTLIDSLEGITKGMATGVLGANKLDMLANPDMLAIDDISLALWITTRVVIFADSACDSDANYAQQLTDTDGIHVSPHSADALENTDVLLTTQSEQLPTMFKNRNVSLVIGMSGGSCRHIPWSAVGFDHIDVTEENNALCSHETMVERFLNACETATGTIVVHASSIHSIRAAICISCFLMKHFRFTTRQAIGWIEFCGSQVIMPSAHKLLLERMQTQLWAQGDAFRRAQEESEVRSLADPLPITGKMEIMIGNMRLERNSLLGTPKKHEARAPPSTGRVQTPPDSVSMKRRPFTQGGGSNGRRLLSRGSERGIRGTDFAVLHRFVHQTSAAVTSPPLRRVEITTPRTQDTT